MAKEEPKSKFGFVATVLIISLAVAGYFTGIQAPMKGRVEAQRLPRKDLVVDSVDDHVLPATHYSDLSKTNFGPNKDWKTSLAMLKPAEVDPLKPITITPQQKTFALAIREVNRAFNGAPPTIPHPIDQMSVATCTACHTDGIQTETLRIPRMSHPHLTNCTQCHVENSPKHMTAEDFRENSFVGLPAPNGGPRAYVGAPPQIPHSVWMRNECLSCHGPSGNFGIRTTHPWRTNCQQCHAPSSELNQVQLDPIPKFLPPPRIEN